MDQLEICPCCGNNNKKRYWAIIAPFIIDYVKPSNQGVTSLYQCLSCGHRFFRDRFSPNEMDRLYSEYRGKSYLEVRKKVEPWYTELINDANLVPSIIKKRKEGLKTFLSSSLGHNNNLMVIADVGGDAGQFIPQEIASNAYVVETSSQNPVAGVVRVQTLDEVPLPIDILICAHVLEHISFPSLFLNNLVSSSALSENCLIYLEVPSEQFRLANLLKSNLYLGYLRVIASIRFITVLVDFLSVLSRSYLGFIFPPLLLKLHEHINFFTKESLTRLAQSSGLEVLCVSEEFGSTIRTHQGVFRLLAHKIK